MKSKEDRAPFSFESRQRPLGERTAERLRAIEGGPPWIYHDDEPLAQAALSAAVLRLVAYLVPPFWMLALSGIAAAFGGWWWFACGACAAVGWVGGVYVALGVSRLSDVESQP